MKIKNIALWKVFLATLLLLALPVLFVFSLERYTTSNEDYCMTCHYKMWGKDFLVHSNIHPDSVRCPQCHAAHEEIIPKEYSAHAERINPNCVRCHEEILEKEDVEGFKALCTDCHFNIKHDKFIPVTNRPRMDTCYDCHDEETTPCHQCHQHGSHEILASLPRTDTIDKGYCDTCHSGFEDTTIPFYGVRFPHKRHWAQGLACDTCHSNANMHGEIIRTREECMQCHHVEQERPCLTCHSLENQFRQGVANTEVPGEPDVMADMVDCEGCHVTIAEGHKREAVLEACGSCHEEGMSLAVTEAQEKAKTGIAELEGLLKEGRAKAKTVADTSRVEVDILIARVERSLATLKDDRSRGFHNPAYTSHLVQEAREALEQALTRQDAGLKEKDK
jgi:hypothetical protein